MPRYEIRESRHYSDGIGMRHAGDVVEIPVEIGDQLVRQGFAVEQVERAKARTQVERTKAKTEE